LSAQHDSEGERDHCRSETPHLAIVPSQALYAA
jgi:hypothetical protein